MGKFENIREKMYETKNRCKWWAGWKYMIVDHLMKMINEWMNTDRITCKQPTVEIFLGTASWLCYMFRVFIKNNASMSDHVLYNFQVPGQILYAIKLLKSRGMDDKSIQSVCQATIVSRKVYAGIIWWHLLMWKIKVNCKGILNRAEKRFFTTMVHL